MAAPAHSAPRSELAVRRGGLLDLPAGRRLVWSVAEGSHGRRWRGVSTHGDGRMEAALLVETTPSGGLARLELATGEGLLTLHPGVDPARLHGNVVRADGVEHVSLPWSAGHMLLVGASPVTAAIGIASAAGGIGVGEGSSVPVVEAGIDLRLRLATWRVARVGERRWRMLAADGGPSLVLELDDDGIATAPGRMSWPLELSEPQR